MTHPHAFLPTDCGEPPDWWHEQSISECAADGHLEYQGSGRCYCGWRDDAAPKPGCTHPECDCRRR